MKKTIGKKNITKLKSIFTYIESIDPCLQHLDFIKWCIDNQWEKTAVYQIFYLMLKNDIVLPKKLSTHFIQIAKYINGFEWMNRFLNILKVDLEESCYYIQDVISSDDEKKIFHLIENKKYISATKLMMKLYSDNNVHSDQLISAATKVGIFESLAERLEREILEMAANFQNLVLDEMIKGFEEYVYYNEYDLALAFLLKDIYDRNVLIEKKLFDMLKQYVRRYGIRDEEEDFINLNGYLDRIRVKD